MDDLSRLEQTLALVREAGVLRPRDLKAHGLSREYLRRLEQRGLILRSSRGLYIPADADLTESHSLAEACKRVPHGVICLLSALQFHGLTTQAPFEVWMAIDGKARLPRIGYPPLRIVRFSGEALSYGVEEHWIEGVPVQVYSPAKTVADCFKYRNKVGLDVALEALRETWRERRATMDAIYRAANVCRVDRVMQPYLEAMVA
jgi:predicted transcriptional regulator of viral defense system